MTDHPFRTFVLALVLAGPLLGLAACEREGPAERAGKQVDEAVEGAGEAMENAGEAVQRKVE